MPRARHASPLALVALALAAGAAPAADHPLPGKSLRIKDGKLVRMIARPGTPIPVPAASGPADPRTNPASLLVDDLGSGGELTEADLAGGLWRALGNPPGSAGWLYANPAAGPGADPVRRLVLRERVLKVVTKDDGTLDGPVAGSVGVFLALGGDVWCARFGGTTQKNEPGLVRRRDAPAPPDCGLPAPPVCGNGVAEVPDEECDDGGTAPGDGCSAACQLEAANPALCAGVPSGPGTTLALELVAGGLEAPVHVAAPRLDPNRLFVVEQPGRIRVVRNGSLLGTPYLDITGLVAYGPGSEEGLLSVAFHPDFETNGHFFVYYVNNAGNLVIARYTASGDPSASDVADAGSALVFTTVPHPGAGNHNGGQLTFGPDGFLYAGIGDGGGGCDPGDNAQDDADARGKLLRIDPAATPPVDPVTTIWAKGLRNPFRLSFDRGTGDLYVGDVGQNGWEEIDHDPAPVSSGVNYGWDLYEGTHCASDPPSSCGGACPPPTGLTMPVHEYDHGQGCSVAGGFVYRGCAIPDLDGVYFYSDYCSSFVRTFEVIGGAAQNHADRTADVDPGGAIGNLSSFGEDARGELYVVDHAGFAPGAGEVYRIVRE